MGKRSVALRRETIFYKIDFLQQQSGHRFKDQENYSSRVATDLKDQETYSCREGTDLKIKRPTAAHWPQI
ncbi:hypothetical protein J6590_085121 [Homalodisca vitripennis]|nr:hypothetical protein J6590_085121 [Homalodisca vitripennis]